MSVFSKTRQQYPAAKHKPEHKPGLMTYRDYYELDDGNRYELINGEIIMSPAPSFFHRDFSLEFALALKYHCESNNLGKIIVSPIDVILDRYNTVQPDIVFISEDNYKNIEERGISGAPDLVVEILSSSSVIQDRYTKKELYEKFGVKEYWIVDLGNRAVEVFLNQGGKFELAASGIEKDKIKSIILEGFEADLEKLFSGLDKLKNLRQ